MKIIYTILVLYLSTVTAWAQLYTGGNQQTGRDDFSRFEFSAGWEASSGEMVLNPSHTSTSGAQGVFGRALVYVNRYAGVGLEGTWFSDQKFAPLVTKYKISRLGIVGKLHLSPNTNPRIYLIAGTGYSNHQLKYVSWFDGSADKKEIFYGILGCGIETNLYKTLFLTVEGRFLYNFHTRLTNQYALKNRWEPALRLGLGIRF